MSDDNNADYYRGRAENARRLAESAVSASIRKIHEEMAENYELLANDAEGRPTLRIVTPK